MRFPRVSSRPLPTHLPLLLPLLLLMAVLSAAVAGADPGIQGTWLTENADAKIRLAPCGTDELCGKLVWLKDGLDERGRPKVDEENPDPALRDRTLLGLPLLSDFPLKPNDDNRWSDGDIYDPESGRTYSAHMTLDGDRLKIRGFLGISLLGRTTVWTRTEDVEPPSE